jgi:hypothetical protein
MAEHANVVVTARQSIAGDLPSTNDGPIDFIFKLKKLNNNIFVLLKYFNNDSADTNSAIKRNTKSQVMQVARIIAAAHDNAPCRPLHQV